MADTLIHEAAGVRTLSPAAYYVGRVKTKLAMKQYKTESITCFCGTDNAHIVTDKDRYGIPHTMNLCKACGIIYASPRMIEDAYVKFYQDEYRKIYDFGIDPDKDFELGIRKSEVLQGVLTEHDKTPRIVFDIGCNSGAWLKPFQDAGAEVYGVDYGIDRIEYGRSKGLPVNVGSISELLSFNKKADLIIMNHVIEHSLDIEQTLKDISKLLSDDGLLYIGVPSVYTWNLSILFQNAHIYQFTAQTLKYVMQCCGFDDLFLDESIFSLWLKTDTMRNKTSIPNDEARRIMNYISGNKKLAPEIKTINKFPIKTRKENIQTALYSKLPDIYELRGTLSNIPAVIVGGGPSVSEYIETIREMQANGMAIIVIERMYQCLLNHDIKPDYVTVMDASEDVIESFKYINLETIHLVATQVKPDIINKLYDYRTYIFNTPQKGINLAAMWNEHNYDTVTQVNAGGSIVLCSISLAMALGSSNPRNTV